MDQRLREAERALLASDSPADKARLEARRIQLGEQPAPWWREFEVVEELRHNGLPRLLRVAHLETRAEQLVRVYLAPEHLRLGVESLTTAGDVYSLCATLFHMLTDRHPFVGESGLDRMKKIMEQPTPDPREWAPDLPLDLVTVIHRGMQKDPALRPSLEALAAGLAAVFAGSPLPADYAPPRRGVLDSLLSAVRRRDA